MRYGKLQNENIVARQLLSQVTLFISINSSGIYISPLNENIIVIQGPPGEKGEQGTTEIIDYNGNIQEALQVSGIMSMTFHCKLYF